MKGKILFFLFLGCVLVGEGLAKNLYIKEELYSYRDDVVKYATDLTYVITSSPVIGIDKIRIYEDKGQKQVSMEVGEILKEVIRKKAKEAVKEVKAEEKVKDEKGSEAENELKIYFDFNSAKLKECERLKLKEWGKSKVGVKVKVVGYADSLGGESYNKKLSFKRARVVADELRRLGLEVVEVRGEGEVTKECVYGLNRVVEIKVVGVDK